MKVVHPRSKEDRTSDRGSRAWLTRPQLMNMYGSNETLVDNLIAKKIAGNAYKPHPDLPDVPEATLYHVLVDLSNTDETLTTDRLEVTHDSEMEGEARRIDT